MKKLLIIFMSLICLCSFTFFSACKNDKEKGNDYCCVTFIQEDLENIVKKVEKGSALTDIPTPTAKTGYNATWSVTDFSNVTEDITVTVVYEAKTYTIHLESDVDFVGEKEIKVKYNEVPELPTPTNVEKEFLKWVLEDGQDYELSNYNVDGDLTLIAKWGNVGWFGPF